MFSQMADHYGLWQNSGAGAAGSDEFELEPYQFDGEILNVNDEPPPMDTISPILTVSIPPFSKSDLDGSLMVSSIAGSGGGSSSSYSLDDGECWSPSSVLSPVEGGAGTPLPVLSSTPSFVSLEQLNASQESGYKKLPRQGRYSHSRSAWSPADASRGAAGPSPSSDCCVSRAPAAVGAASEQKKVSDSRLSAQGLAKVLKLDSPEEALKRERYILDIFENELHYPLGYKTWVRDTFKDYRVKLIDQLHERVKHRYPEYDHAVLETIIRRATYYMMQSRLRRERRARAKSVKASQSSTNTP